MKTFDLEAAKAGAPCVARDGRRAAFIGAHGNYAYFLFDGQSRPRRRHPDGRVPGGDKGGALGDIFLDDGNEIVPGRNPGRVTRAQLGEGYRLVQAGEKFQTEAQVWRPRSGWEATRNRDKYSATHTYRLPVSIPPIQNIAEGHNPDQLTADQVGEGHRLLRLGEKVTGESSFWMSEQAWSPELKVYGGGFPRDPMPSLTYRTPLVPLAEGHNPDQLTREQVGEGYRLLQKGEMVTQGTEYWSAILRGGSWEKVGPVPAFPRPIYPAVTYRVAVGTRLFLPSLTPPGTVLRRKGDKGWAAVMGVTSEGVVLHTGTVLFDTLTHSDYERSTDGGHTWTPCAEGESTP